MNDRIECLIDALRKKILESAIRGELVPQDPADEPASVLLERIAKERENLIREKKIKKPKSTSRIFRRDRHFYESINGGEPVCIDEEIPFEIPDNWEWCRLKDYCVYGEAANIRVSDCPPNTWVLDLEDIEAHTGRVIQRIAASDRPSSSNKYSFVADSVLYSKLRPYLNKVVVAKEGGCCTTEIIPISLFAKTSPYYLQFFLMSPLFVSEINSDSYGVKMPRADTKKVKSFLIPIPPLQEQQRIVAAVEGRMEKLDLLAESRKRYTRILSGTPTSLRQQLIQAAIQGQLVPQNPDDEPASRLLERIAEERAKLGKKAAKPMSRIERRGHETYEIFPDGTEKDISKEIPFDIPDSWVWARGKALFEPTQNKAPDRDFLYIDIDSIDNKHHVIKDPKATKAREAPSRARRLLQHGDILFSLVRPYLENIALVESQHADAIASTGFYIVRTKAYIPKFAYALFLSPYVIQGLNSFMKGDNSPSIRGENIEDYLYPLPPLQEQQRIVKKLGALLDLI